MTKWLESTGGDPIAIIVDAPLGVVTRVGIQYAGTVWDKIVDCDADYLLCVGGCGELGGTCEIVFHPMREVPCVMDWRQAYRYVGNPLADSYQDRR